MLEFGEFCQLAAKFLVEEDEEALLKELKEAFRIYDKEERGLEIVRIATMLAAAISGTSQQTLSRRFFMNLTTS